MIYVVGVLRRRLRIPPSCPAGLARLLALCWDSDPPARPSFLDIVPLLEVSSVLCPLTPPPSTLHAWNPDMSKRNPPVITFMWFSCRTSSAERRQDREAKQACACRFCHFRHAGKNGDRCTCQISVFPTELTWVSVCACPRCTLALWPYSVG